MLPPSAVQCKKLFCNRPAGGNGNFRTSLPECASSRNSSGAASSSGLTAAIQFPSGESDGPRAATEEIWTSAGRLLAGSEPFKPIFQIWLSPPVSDANTAKLLSGAQEGHSSVCDQLVSRSVRPVMRSVFHRLY